MSAWTFAHAAAVVATSASDEPLSTRPLAAPAIHGLTSFVPSKTSRGKPPCLSRRVAAAVVPASNVALSSGVAPRGKDGVHARMPRVVAVNARTCALSSGHCRRSLASASRSSAVGSPASSSSPSSSNAPRETSSVRVAERRRNLSPRPRRRAVAGRATRRPDAAFDEIRSLHNTCAVPETVDAAIVVRPRAPRGPKCPSIPGLEHFLSSSDKTSSSVSRELDPDTGPCRGDGRVQRQGEGKERGRQEGRIRPGRPHEDRRAAQLRRRRRPGLRHLSRRRPAVGARQRAHRHPGLPEGDAVSRPGRRPRQWDAGGGERPG